MRSGPEVLVGEPVHTGLSICGVVHLLVYGGGFMAYCTFACWRLRDFARSSGTQGIGAAMWYHFFFFKFRPQRYYYGLIQLARSAFIALAPILIPDPHVQVVLLQVVLCSYLVVHSLLWPYRFELHNLVDLATSACMITLTTAAAFFLPVTPGTNDASVVQPVVVVLGVTLASFLVVLAIQVWRFLRRFRMTAEERAKHLEMATGDRTSFLAELLDIGTHDQEDLHEQSKAVDVEAICASPLPDLSGPGAIIACTAQNTAEGALTFVAPGRHPDMVTVRECLGVFEAKLRWQARAFVAASNKGRAGATSSWSGALVAPPPRWSAEERRQVGQLIERAQAFLERYVQSLVADPAAMEHLRTVVRRMEQRFKGIYIACARDIVRPQPGFDQALEVARALMLAAEGDVKTLSSAEAGECIVLMEAAAQTQEAVSIYVKELADATGATAPRSSMKHLYRILEKQALNPAKGADDATMPVWDAARAMLVYEDMACFLRGLEQIQRDREETTIEVLRVKDRFSEPTGGGWSDVLINLRFPAKPGQPNPLPWEIQMVHVKMLVVRKDMGGHEAYAQYRAACEILDLHRHIVAEPTAIAAERFSQLRTREVQLENAVARADYLEAHRLQQELRRATAQESRPTLKVVMTL
jgi:hypothetical protein